MQRGGEGRVLPPSHPPSRPPAAASAASAAASAASAAASTGAAAAPARGAACLARRAGAPRPPSGKLIYAAPGAAAWQPHTF